jgi:hypothetical protein
MVLRRKTPLAGGLSAFTEVSACGKASACAKASAFTKVSAFAVATADRSADTPADKLADWDGE